MQKLYCVKINEQEIDRMFAETAETKAKPFKAEKFGVTRTKQKHLEDRVLAMAKSPFPSAAVSLKSRFRPLEERRGKKFF